MVRVFLTYFFYIYFFQIAMNNLQNTFLKLLSIILILFTHLPSQKFSIPYGMSILTTLSERINELDFSLDLILSFIFISGIVCIFMKNKWLNLFGFIFLVIPLISFSWGKPLENFEFSFWGPLFLFILLSSYITFNKMVTD